MTLLPLVGSILPPLLVCAVGLTAETSVSQWGPPALFQGLWCASESWFVRRYREQGAFEMVPAPLFSLGAGVAAGVIFLATTFDGLVRSPDHQFPRFPGFALGMAGVLLRLLAIRQLGPRFLDGIAILPGHKMETAGIYKVFRHPAESGLCMAMLGYALLCQSTAGLIMVFAIQIPLSLERMRRENRLFSNFDHHDS